MPDTRGMFGTRDQVDPVRHVIGSASAWGGNPETEALYLNRVAPRNDGRTVYRVRVADVPVKGSWSISVHDAEGYYAPNDLNACTIDNLTATPAEDGGVTARFGGRDGTVPNCLSTLAGWTWMVRRHRPEAAVLEGGWVFPELEAVD